MYLETNKKKKKTNQSLKTAEYLTPHAQKAPESPRFQEVIKCSVIFGKSKGKLSWNKFFPNINMDRLEQIL